MLTKKVVLLLIGIAISFQGSVMHAEVINMNTLVEHAEKAYKDQKERTITEIRNEIQTLKVQLQTTLVQSETHDSNAKIYLVISLASAAALSYYINKIKGIVIIDFALTRGLLTTPFTGIAGVGVIFTGATSYKAYDEYVSYELSIEAAKKLIEEIGLLEKELNAKIIN